MRPCAIVGYGTFLPPDAVKFGDNTRYRVTADTSQLDMLEHAARQALDRAGLDIADVDCVLGAVGVGVQPIPSTAALLLERFTASGHAAAFDINSTCTSFITAVDIASRYLRDGEYNTILIVSGDLPSPSLNPDQQESYELFSDAAAAVVLQRSDDPSKGVISSLQRTWAKHAHDTEVRGGLSAYLPNNYTADTANEFRFDMDGKRALLAMMRVLPEFFRQFFERSPFGIDDVALYVPHQASPALVPMLERIGIPPHKAVNSVADYGNMVSASVPYALVKSLEAGDVGEGDLVVLCGTAAGLTANALALRL